MAMSMKGVFNLLERINLRNTGKAGLDDKLTFSENVNFHLKSTKKEDSE
tara:strand:- start:54 stop:200 length:147 start_codon:yes stop_codon:yes gene_type:complete